MEITPRSYLHLPLALQAQRSDTISEGIGDGDKKSIIDFKKGSY